MSEVKYFHDVFSAMIDNDSRWLKSAKESAAFYTGGFGSGQWSDADIRKLRSEGRPPLQLNMVLPKVNSVTGVERQNRSSFRAVPQDIEDDGIAQIITALLFHLDSNRYLQNLFSRVFKDGVLTGRGWIDLSIEQGQYFDADIRIRRESWANVLIDPEADSPDVSTWSRLARTKFMPLSQLKQMFPDEMKDATDVKDILMPKYSAVNEEVGGTYNTGAMEINEAMYLDNHRQKVRVVELWERDFVTEYFVMNKRTGRIDQNAFSSRGNARDDLVARKDEIINRPIPADVEVSQYNSIRSQILSEMENLTVVNRIMPKTYLSMFTGARLLIDKKPNPYKHNEFPLIPYFYLFEDMGEKIETFGLVENLKDPQREKDKRRSQALDIMNRSPRGGGIFSGNKVSAEQMNQASSAGKWIGVPGFKGKISDFMAQWSNQHQGLISTAVALEQQAENDMIDISGVNQPMMGNPSNSKESGLAAQIRVRQAMMGLQEQLDNLDTAKMKTLDMSIKMMQQYFTPNKINRILGVQDLEPQDMQEYNQTLQRFLKDFEYMKFDIVLDEGKTSPTLRAMKAAQVADLIRQGYGSLLPLYLELADFEAAPEILEKVKEQAQSQQQAQAPKSLQEGQSV